MLQQHVYWATWTPDSARKLGQMTGPYTTVYLAFSKPDSTYKKGSFTFNGSGMEFTDFAAARDSIRLLRQKGIKVMLSVGGGVAKFLDVAPYANFQNAVDLANDLGCDGIDIDWEPERGSDVDYCFGPIIAGFKSRLSGTCQLLSAACWSTGAYGKREGQNWCGMNIAGMISNGNDLNWINIMAYDSGPPSQYDALGAFTCYRSYYKGPLYLGMELGVQAWGGYLITKDQIVKQAEWVKKDGNGGTFVWEYQKDSTGTPNLVETAALVTSVFGCVPPQPPPPPTPQPPPPPTPLPVHTMTCPKCSTKLKLGLYSA